MLKIVCQDIRDININSVKLIDTNGVRKEMKYSRKDGGWVLEANFTEPKLIYKFVINECMVINDSKADQYILIDNEIWSVRNLSKEKTNFNAKGSIVYSKSVVSTQISNKIHSSMEKREFYIGLNKRVIVGVECNEIIGIHELMVLWICPNKSIGYINTENILFHNNFDEYQALVWFEMITERVKKAKINGLWTIVIFLDGEAVKTEYFLISEV